MTECSDGNVAFSSSMLGADTSPTMETVVDVDGGGRHHHESGQQRRIFEYFAIVGLEENMENAVPLEQSGECGCKTEQPLAPITDVCVIFPSLGEGVSY